MTFVSQTRERWLRTANRWNGYGEARFLQAIAQWPIRNYPVFICRCNEKYHGLGLGSSCVSAASGLTSEPPPLKPPSCAARRSLQNCGWRDPSIIIPSRTSAIPRLSRRPGTTAERANPCARRARSSPSWYRRYPLEFHLRVPKSLFCGPSSWMKSMRSLGPRSET